MSFYPFILHEISVLIELTLGHLCSPLTDMPPQPNSPPDYVFRVDHRYIVYSHKGEMPVRRKHLSLFPRPPNRPQPKLGAAEDKRQENKEPSVDPPRKERTYSLPYKPSRLQH